MNGNDPSFSESHSSKRRSCAIKPVVRSGKSPRFFESEERGATYFLEKGRHVLAPSKTFT